MSKEKKLAKQNTVGIILPKGADEAEGLAEIAGAIIRMRNDMRPQEQRNFMSSLKTIGALLAEAEDVLGKGRNEYAEALPAVWTATPAQLYAIKERVKGIASSGVRSVAWARQQLKYIKKMIDAANTWAPQIVTNEYARQAADVLKIKGVYSLSDSHATVPSLNQAQDMMKRLDSLADDGNKIKDIRNAAMMSILFQTGIRHGQLLNLRQNDIAYNEDINAHILRLRPFKHTKEMRRIKLPKESVARLRRWIAAYHGGCELRWQDHAEPKDSDNFMFTKTSTKGNKVVDPHSGLTENVVNRVKNWLVDDGFNKFTPHDARRFAANQLKLAGVSLESISEHLGHKSTTTTKGYITVPMSADLKGAEPVI